MFFSLAPWNLGLVVGYLLTIGIPPAVKSSQAWWSCILRQGALAVPASRTEKLQPSHEAPSPDIPLRLGLNVPLNIYTDPNPKSSQTATPRALGDSPGPVQLIDKRGYSVLQQQNLRSNSLWAQVLVATWHHNLFKVPCSQDFPDTHNLT